MRKIKQITAAEAVAFVKDGDTVASSGFVGSAIPEALIGALEARFLETGSPRSITYFYAGSQGNRDGRGGDHMAHKGLTKRVIAGHYATAPALGKCILNNEIEGYNLPQGTLSQLFRDIAAHKLGTLTHVGIGTFADPRLGGGKLNEISTEDLVEVVNVLGQERLLYKAFPINVAFIRGSYADESGNVTMHREIAEGEVTAIAQAAKNSGGKVFV
ncbi:MAG: 3-oxoacid CoA-transferase, partial [Clostridiales Family XIII bacterium]|nr:3-oxoacid CoA-transferase [Clostridiales Family XIII bacterium]